MAGEAHIRSEPLDGHPVLRGLLEFSAAGEEIALIACRDGAFVTLRDITADQIAQVVALRSGAEIGYWHRGQPSYQHGAGMLLAVFGDVSDALAVLRDVWEGKFLRSSARVPGGNSESLRGLYRKPGDPDAFLCRDDDCTGLHAWLLRLGREREFSYLWHVNLATLRVVPPDPMVIGR